MKSWRKVGAKTLEENGSQSCYLQDIGVGARRMKLNAKRLLTLAHSVLFTIVRLFSEIEPSFPYRDVTIRRGVEFKDDYDIQSELGR